MQFIGKFLPTYKQPRYVRSAEDEEFRRQLLEPDRKTKGKNKHCKNCKVQMSKELQDRLRKGLKKAMKNKHKGETILPLVMR